MPIQYRSTEALIDLDALRFNVRQIRKKIPATTQIIGVVKANAYGHGAVQCARILESEGVRILGVATVEEGMELRQAGLRGDILVFDGLATRDLTAFGEYRLRPVLHSMEEIDRFGAFLHDRTRSQGVHIKFDTGMGRLGLFPSHVDDLLDKLRRYSEMDVQGVMTHLARADEEDRQPTERQIELFDRVRQILETRGMKTAFHIANSAAIIEGLGLDYALVRPGLMLYGAYPHSRMQEKMELKPVMSLKTKVLAIKRHPMGNALGYGGTFTTKRESLIGVLPLGYADGYPRLLSNRASVMVHGKKAPVVGRISMDLTLVDLTDIPEAKEGDEVLLFGTQGESKLSVEEVATWADTISYEILCGVSSRVPRIYTNL